MFTFAIPIYGSRIGLSASSIGLVLGSFSVATFVIRGLPACDLAAADRVAAPHGIPGNRSRGLLLFPLLERASFLMAVPSCSA